MHATHLHASSHSPSRWAKASEVFQELFSADTRSGVDGQLHLVDLLVDLLHEVNDEVHQLVLEHLLRVHVGDEEADVIVLWTVGSDSAKVYIMKKHYYI